MVESVQRVINPPNVPNQMGKEWYLNVKQAIEEAIQAGACKKMDLDYNLLPFVSTRAASPAAIGYHCKPAYDEEGVLLPYAPPSKINIAC